MLRSGAINSVNRAFPYLGRGCVLVVAAVSIVTTELSVATTWSAAPSTVVSSTTAVNRTQKGDRLRLLPMLPVKPTEQIGLNDQALPVGCEAVTSPLTLAHSRLAHTAGACVS
jgi:hypothetical protein